MEKVKADGNIWAIPDIHGRLDLLTALWKTLLSYGLDLTRDKVVFLGDYIDRGPDSKGVLDFLIARRLESENVICLAGNHEWLFISALRGHRDDHDLWMANGGLSTVRSFPGPTIPISYIEWLEALPLFHEEEGFFFSHAPQLKENCRRLPDQGQPFTKDELIWNVPWNEKDETRDFGADTVGVCGHTHRAWEGIFVPRIYPHYMFLDSGCGCSRSGPLVAVEVKTRTPLFAWPDGPKVQHLPNSRWLLRPL